MSDKQNKCDQCRQRKMTWGEIAKDIKKLEEQIAAIKKQRSKRYYRIPSWTHWKKG